MSLSEGGDESDLAVQNAMPYLLKALPTMTTEIVLSTIFPPPWVNRKKRFDDGISTAFALRIFRDKLADQPLRQ